MIPGTLSGLLSAFLLGVLLGAALAALSTAARLRRQAEARLIDAAERTQRAETAADELRKQLDGHRMELAELRRTLAAAQEARVAAATRSEEAFKSLQEQKTLLTQARDELANTFKVLSGEALKTNNEVFLNLARTSFEAQQMQAKGELQLRQQAIDEVVRPLREALSRYEEQVRELERNRHTAYGGLEQHLRTLATSHDRLQQETANLVNALRTPAARGRWGELSLRRLAELAGMVRHCDFVEQPTIESEGGRLRPDMLVHLPNGREIVVDAKTVLSAYLEAHEATTDEHRQDALRRHALQVRTQLEQLSVKAYWSQFSHTPEFVVLFLPGEQFLGAALEQDPALLEDGFARQIVLATPTTLFAVLRAVAFGWQQAQMSENARQVAKLGKDLFERMAVLAEHVGGIGQALERSVHAYNRAVGSLNDRLLPAARRFKELGIGSEKDVPPLDAIETVPRGTPVPRRHEEEA